MSFGARQEAQTGEPGAAVEGIKSGKFTVDALSDPREYFYDELHGDRQQSPVPAADPFLQYLAFQAGIADFATLVDLTQIEAGMEETNRTLSGLSGQALDKSTLYSPVARGIGQRLIRFFVSERKMVVLHDTAHPLEISKTPVHYVKFGWTFTLFPSFVRAGKNLYDAILECFFSIKETQWLSIVSNMRMVR